MQENFIDKMSDNKSTSLQTRLLERIKTLIPPNINLVDELSDLLQISSDSVYRRLRNETSLSIGETAKLCKHFHISFDEINDQAHDKSVSFNFSRLNTAGDYTAYLQSIHDDLLQFSKTGDCKFIWAAKDFPIFHHFQFPEVTAFMIYYWFHCIIDTDEHRDQQFSIGSIDNDILELAQKIYQLYSGIPSMEIWSNLSIVPLLVQLDYVWQSGLFEKAEDALTICSLIEQELETIRKEAEMGCKLGIHNNPTGRGSYQLYLSDIEIGNNTILVKMGDSKVTYLTHNTLNKIATVNPDFCDATEIWINNLVRKSTLISGVSEKQRYQFFNSMKSQLKQVEQKIRSSVKV